MKKLLFLAILSGYASAYIGCSDSGCTEYISTKNKHGVVLIATGIPYKFISSSKIPIKLKSARRLKRETLYVGRQCDTFSKRYGKGSWSWSNSGFVLRFRGKEFSFPKQFLDIRTVKSCKERNFRRIKKSHSRNHPSLRGLVQGMSYARARRVLLNNGWQATYARWQDLPEFGREHDYYFDKGWREVESCSGTGMGYCLFKFHDHYGNRLDVVTEGDNPVVSNWSLKSR
jgi:hypothetical protein